MQHLLNIGQSEVTTTMILVAAAACVLVALVFARRRRRAHGRRDDELPPLVFAVRDRSVPTMRPAGLRGREAPETPPSATAPAAAGDRPRTAQRHAPSDVPVGVPRFAEPIDGTEYLPGRLEIRSGARRGEEIRFARTHGEAADVVLGRAEGPPDRYVRIPAETVSDRQARMQYENGRWKITNLSREIPTVVNGEELTAGRGIWWLEDGDTIEMGEVVLQFRER